MKKSYKKNFAKNILVYSLAFSFIIISLSVGYYFFKKQQLDYKKFQIEQEEKNKEAEKESYYQFCADEAEKNARDLLKKKIELLEKSGGSQYQTYKEAYEKGLHLRDDYDNYFNNCLEKYGLNK